MANPSHDNGNITDAEIAGYMGWRGPGAYTEASLRKIREIIDHVLRVERATPPSPSTAPDGKLRPRYKADGNRVVREHGGLLAQTYIPAEAVYITNALNEQAERMSSRPAEVDDEGLPPLPVPAHRGPDGAGSYFDSFTAEQYRQGQRDAVAADRARREKGGA